MTRGVCLRTRTFAFLCIALAAPLTLAASEAPADLPAYQIRGAFTTKYISRTADGAAAAFADRDLFADLRIDVRKPDGSSPEFHFLGAVRSDLNGVQTTPYFSPFEDISDTHERRAAGTLYEAYVLLRDGVRPDTVVRIGRQAGTRDEQLFFDGISTDIDLGGEKLNLALFLGSAAHFYQVHGAYGRDTVHGVGLDFRPLPGTGISADLLAVAGAPAFAPDDGTIHERLLSLRASQRLGAAGAVSAKYRFEDQDPRDLTVRAVTFIPGGCELQAGYVRQFRTQDERTTELSPFADVVGRSAPYETYDLRARKLFGDRFALDLGHIRRSLLDPPADQGPFDRQFRRTSLGAELLDLGMNGLSWTVTAELWESATRKFRTAGTDLSYAVKRIGQREAKVSLGSSFSLYRYDYYATLGVREQVRLYYCSAQYPVGAGFSANAAFEHEHGIEDYDTLRLGMRYDF